MHLNLTSLKAVRRIKCCPKRKRMDTQASPSFRPVARWWESASIHPPNSDLQEILLPQQNFSRDTHISPSYAGQLQAVLLITKFSEELNWKSTFKGFIFVFIEGLRKTICSRKIFEVNVRVKRCLWNNLKRC